VELYSTPKGTMKHAYRWGIVLAVLFSLLSPLRAAETGESRPREQNTPPVAIAGGDLINSEPVTVWGHTLISYRLAIEFPDVQHRARATEKRITQALGSINPEKLSVQPLQIGEAHGFAVMSGNTFLLKVMEGDLDPEVKVPLATVAEKIVAEIRLLVHDHAAQHSTSLMIRAGIHSIIATVFFAAFWALVAWLKSRALLRIARSTERVGHMFNILGYDWRPVLLGIATTATQLLMLAVVLSGTYLWVTFVLGRFPYTRHWGDQLGAYLISIVSSLTSGAVSQIPNLVALIVIYLATRGLIRILNGWFFAIETGKQMTIWLDAEAARATRRLVGIGVWIVALIVAFPYLPGSHSEAFKGISVFLGLMISLGGAGFVSQIIGGLAAVYSRAVRSGDYIIVGETQGTVKELGLLTTKVITRTREEVTIPNSILISSAIRNFSRGNGNTTLLSTAVTIGYDAPWRQVQAMLLKASAATEGILNDPTPFVLQTALDDFYVRYELTACVESSSTRNEVLDRLHGKIQDVFNEHGVQIMSPHFKKQPAENVVVPKDRWYAAPAKPPA
jgi:small-conductance mechanosensitive channel